MTPASEPDLRQVAEEAATRGGAVLRPFFRRGGLEVEAKARHDFVTEADRASENEIVTFLQRSFPQHRILTEESGSLAGEGEIEWIIDPLDGTTNFLQGYPAYAVSVACRRGDELLAGVVFDPEGGNLFSAARGQGADWNGRPMRVSEAEGLSGAFLATGFPFKAHEALALYLEVFAAVFQGACGIRRCGAAALDLAYTAAGVFDGFFEFRLAPWDIAAGALLVREAGGEVRDLDGGALYLESGNVLAGGRSLMASLEAAVGEIASEAKLDSLTPR